MTIRKSAKRLLMHIIGDRRYYEARAKRNLRRAQRQDLELLFIHQMGKVGSTAITKSLRANGYDQKAKIIQTHFLTPQGRAFLEKLETESQGGWQNLTPRTKNVLTNSRVIGQMLQDGYLKHHRPRVITLVRDPIATNLSGFFHNYLWWPQKLQTRAREKKGEYLQDLYLRFMEAYPHDVPLNWFDLEMKPLFGIDVFAEEFPKEQGFKIYRGQSATLLLLKLEKVDDCAEEAFADFLEIQDFELMRANEAADKWYASLYQELKRTVSFPTAYADKLYETRYMKQFYTETEITTFRQKWCAA